ncbi:hypothetical protein, partial [Xenorhabdus szentirmaii]|uniref:hypothetical protein n=1 Tax=Xenorhabdus szentirmaii TaxID=290112 RepID=UPI002B40458A
VKIMKSAISYLNIKKGPLILNQRAFLLPKWNPTLTLTIPTQFHFGVKVKKLHYKIIYKVYSNI